MAFNPLINLIFPEMVTSVPSQENKIYLTFDDGPTPGVTEQVLAFLLSFNARATFFCKGKNAETFPHLFSQLTEAGHSVGNHSYSHPDGWFTPKKGYIQDVHRADAIIHSRLFRPPYGRIGILQYMTLKQYYKIIGWSALSWDFHPALSQEWCLVHVVRNIRPGAILVFHDTQQAAGKLFFLLPRILEKLQSKGYSMQVLPF